MPSLPTVVIGAGAVGLAVARSLARAGREVVVLEALPAIGSVTSSRNSEVIHAGVYYPEGSLKAAACVAGRRALYAYCDAHGVPYKRCGKLIVATSEDQHGSLDAILRRSHANGLTAPDEALVRLSAAEAMALEPELRCTAALLSPSTGVLDSHAFMLALQGDAEDAGAMIAFNAPVVGAAAIWGSGGERGEAGGRRAEAGTGGRVLGVELDVGGEAPTTIECGTVVNCAGLHAPALAAMLSHGRLGVGGGRGGCGGGSGSGCGGGGGNGGIGGNGGGGSGGGNFHGDGDAARTPPTSTTTQEAPGGGSPAAVTFPRFPVGRYAKGNYYRLQGVAAPFEKLVYPVPDENLAGLGVHITVDIGGQARFGPDVEWLEVEGGAGGDSGDSGDSAGGGGGGGATLDAVLQDYTVDPSRAATFYEAVRRYWPALPDGSLEPDYAGIRPKLGPPTEGPPPLSADAFRLDDFNILGPSQHGVPGVIHLLGIESPGLTASLALADEVLRQLDGEDGRGGGEG
jgi:L-2-hydroxyglutarate oxidase LhgO